MAADGRDFEEFVKARTPSLLRAAYLLTGDQQLAEDLVQSALARAHRAWGCVHDGNPRAYVRRAMYHLQVSWWRRRRFAETALSSAAEPVAVVDDASMTVASRLDLRRALRCLGVRQRAVVVLRFFEDFSEAETAEVLGCTVGTVKSQTAKALARLRALVPETEVGEEGPR